MSLEKNKSTWQSRVDASLDKWLPRKTIEPEQLHTAMRYAVFNGGKRVRPILAYAAGQAAKAPIEMLDHIAAAVECIHAYSLVHDDLPAMDDDDLRRGKPTTHKAFDEATAILAGDALQALAFHILAHGLDEQIPAGTRLSMIDQLAIASGSRGMAGGQAIDLAAVGREINEAELENMHIHKTGALIRVSVRLGALCAPNLETEKSDNPFVGKSIHEANVREEVGGLVVGLERKGFRMLNPDSSTVLKADDLLLVVGKAKVKFAEKEGSE